MENNQKTACVTGYCEYAGRVVPIFCTYSSSGSLMSIECPKNMCSKYSRCKLVQDVPRFTPVDEDA